MKKSKKMLVGTLAFMMIFSAGVYASQSGLYQAIVNRLMGLSSTYTEKESQLVEEGYQAQEDIRQFAEGLESEFKKELDVYETEEVNRAKQELKKQVQEVKNQVNADKDKILNDIKVKIKDKVEKDLEKELRNLEKALEKRN